MNLGRKLEELNEREDFYALVYCCGLDISYISSLKVPTFDSPSTK